MQLVVELVENEVITIVIVVMYGETETLDVLQIEKMVELVDGDKVIVY